MLVLHLPLVYRGPRQLSFYSSLDMFSTGLDIAILVQDNVDISTDDWYLLSYCMHDTVLVKMECQMQTLGHLPFAITRILRSR
jgi:hypothetical protein